MHRFPTLRCAAALLLSSAFPAYAGQGLHLSEHLHAGAPTNILPVPAPDAAVTLLLDGDLRESLVRTALETGESMLGTDYELGADRTDAVDCSSLVRRMFRSVGLHLPRTAGEQMSIGRAVAAGQLAPGDLLFYRFGRRSMHVAVYVDDGRVLHASTGAGRVIVSTLDEHWRRRMVAARRLL